MHLAMTPCIFLADMHRAGTNERILNQIFHHQTIAVLCSGLGSVQFTSMTSRALSGGFDPQEKKKLSGSNAGRGFSQRTQVRSCGLSSALQMGLPQPAVAEPEAALPTVAPAARAAMRLCRRARMRLHVIEFDRLPPPKLSGAAAKSAIDASMTKCA